MCVATSPVSEFTDSPAQRCAQRGRQVVMPLLRHSQNLFFDRKVLQDGATVGRRRGLVAVVGWVAAG